MLLTHCFILFQTCKLLLWFLKFSMLIPLTVTPIPLVLYSIFLVLRLWLFHILPTYCLPYQQVLTPTQLSSITKWTPFFQYLILAPIKLSMQILQLNGKDSNKITPTSIFSSNPQYTTFNLSPWCLTFLIQPSRSPHSSSPSLLQSHRK